MQERLPRSAGEILSDAMAVLRRHFKALVFVALPFCAVDLLLREGGQSALQSLPTVLMQDPDRIDVDGLLRLGAAAAGGLGLIIGSAMVLQLLFAGLVALAGSAWHGQELLLGAALDAMARRGAALILTALLFMVVVGVIGLVPVGLVAALAVVGGPIAALAAGIVAAVVVVVAFIVLTLRWGLYTQTVVLEGRLGPGAFARSAELMAGRGVPLFEGAKFRLSILLLIAFALSGTLQSLFAIPRLAVAAATGWSFVDGMPPLASMPLWFIIPFGLLEVVTNALVMPFSSVLLTLFYFDLRVRYEALDLAPPPATAGTSSSSAVPT